MGTFLNRVLKDVFVKVHLLRRHATRKFVPGWDMHGLPIELETLKQLGLDFREVDPIELRARCRERALHWLERPARRRSCGWGCSATTTTPTARSIRSSKRRSSRRSPGSPSGSDL